MAFPVPTAPAAMNVAPSRAGACLNPVMSDAAMQCAKNCFICCLKAKFQCEDAGELIIAFWYTSIPRTMRTLA